MRRRAIAWAALAAATVGSAALRPGASLAQGREAEYGQQQRGKYLVIVGDCAACHTAKDGPSMAGGRPIQTPFGVIYSPNITPDRETGIGGWTDDQFYRALHEGVAADGGHLYPAFPYPWFTKVTRADVEAIRSYLATIPAVKYRRPNNTFPWPLDNREAMVGWNTLYFKAGVFKPDASKSAEWNRGAYLVEGLGHCGACHSPTNALGATETANRFRGGDLQNWFAPNLTSNARVGLGGWSTQQIVEFLKTGHTDRTVAYGPMAEVVEISTSHMTDADLTAMASYLKSLPAAGPSSAPDRPAAGVREAGEAIYADSCSACHEHGGEGVPGMFPALKGDSIVQSGSPTTVVRLILNGGHAPSTATAPTSVSMPAYGWKLSDAQIAAVASYIRSAWGNAASPVSSGAVHDLRSATQTSSAD